MTPTFFALFVALGALYGWLKDPLLVLMVCCLFGGSAALLLPALGGANITPAVLYIPFLAVFALAQGGTTGFFREIAYPSAGFWLLLLVIWCAVAAYFPPRIFAGDVLVSAVTRDTDSPVRSLIALRPVSGNFTQLGYAIGGFLVFVAVRALLRRDGGLERFVIAVLVLAGMNCLAAIVNLAELYAHFPPLLQYARNANYVIFNGGEIGGVVRITGTFSEASAFSAFTLPLFAFTTTLWLRGIRPRLTSVLAAASLAFLLLSTSTTAYAGLLAYVVCIGTVLAWKGLTHGVWLRYRAIVPATVVAVMMLCGLALFDSSAAKALVNFFDLTLFNKLQSASGMERSAWNYQAWLNFIQTYGLGVGLGSARASSYPLVLLSNIGMVGALLYVVFLMRLRPVTGVHADATRQAVSAAARQAVLAALFAAAVSASVFDIGMAFYAFAAAAARDVPAAPAPGMRAYA